MVRSLWPDDLSAPARDVLAVLERRGASFFAELHAGTRRLPNEVEDALWELLARGSSAPTRFRTCVCCSRRS
jgi:ATP-dependent Lhr-like helicase